jgi:3-hydroxyacyl-CoA dehydrogenase
LRASKGLAAAGAAVDAVQAAVTLPFADGIKREAELFQQCRVSTESAALRYLFAGEREVARIPGQAAAPPRQVERVAVIGAGTMGAGVAISFLDAGYPLTLIETTQAALDRGTGNIANTYDGLVSRGRLTAAQRDQRLAQLRPSLALPDAADAGLIIECVFEDMRVKEELMAQLGPLLGPSAILATNTSALDVNALARASGRPADVVGMHFFSPANIMKLVEVVNGALTGPEVLATAMAVAKKIGKIGVVSGVCDGFIGNRMIGGYLKQANLLLFEGALPEQIDAALQNFGMAMGPHAMGDMAGLDIQAAGRRRRLAEGSLSPDEYYGAIADRLVAQGRFGLKSGKGIYRYDPGGRAPLPDPEAVAIMQEEAARRGISPRAFSDDEIIARCVLPLINEGAKILEEGIAFGAVDIDVLYCAGYGFPRARGGPMFYADTLGLDQVLAQMQKFAEVYGPRYWTPSPFLLKLAAARQNFAGLKR